MYILATASNQMKPAEAGRAIAVMLAAISLRNCFASTSTPPGSEWAQLHEQMTLTLLSSASLRTNGTNSHPDWCSHPMI
jgi:hypothetical protein